MKSIEMFAGAGGLGIGLHRAGFHPVNVIEWDAYCCDTILRNKLRKVRAVKGWNVTQGDVREVDFRQYEDAVELVSGGPPCQPFSLGGKHRAHDDRRDMFPQAIRAVREARPKAFVFENVKGLTRASFRNYYEYIRLQMEHPEISQRVDEDWSDHLARLEQHHMSGSRDGLNYRVVRHLVNAADYGVPQRRERVFFVGFREDLGVRWSFPTPTHSQSALLLDQEIGIYWDRHNIPKRERVETKRASRHVREGAVKLQAWQTVRDALFDLPDPEHHPELSGDFPDHRFQPGARSYAGHTGSPLDEPAKTLKAGVHGVPGGENMLLRADGSVRYFSVRESARLQTFPDDYRFQGSWSETMRQLGNAVPVALAEFVGNDVARYLREVA